MDTFLKTDTANCHYKARLIACHHSFFHTFINTSTFDSFSSLKMLFFSIFFQVFFFGFLNYISDL